jgi:elongation factor G
MPSSPTYTTENLRTVAIVGHGGAGKTTLVEQLLAKSGMIGAPGSVEKGSTVSDHDTLEKSTGHSLRSSVVHCDVVGPDRATRVHLIDTPGYPDFLGQSIAALDAVETVAVVVNAVNGVEWVTRRMMELAEQRGLCRMIIVNRIDHPRLDLPQLLADLREAFGPAVLPINLPAGNGARVIDCFDRDEGVADILSVAEVHRQVMEQIVEVDDAAMERYLEEGTADPASLHGPLEAALRSGHLIPVCFVSAKTGAGVQDLLNVMVRHLPNPGEANPPQFTQGEGAEQRTLRSVPDADRHLIAHVFKVAHDPYVGKLGLFRVHQGRIRRDTQIFIGTAEGEARRAFKVTHLMLAQGKDLQEVNELVPGDLGAVSKIDEIEFDSILHESHEEDLVHLRPLPFPHPMLGWAVEPSRRGDEGRMSEVLAKAASEDPTLLVEYDPSQNETVIRGLSELHLRSVLERMATQFRLEVTTRPPRVAYRETVQGPAEGHARHKKQTGGAGQFGEVYLRVEPRERGAGFEFVDQVKGGTIPFNFIPAVEKGVREVLTAGHAAGYPLVDLRVVVYDGKHHPVDSKEVAFVAAGRKAMRDALNNSGITVLEPIVRLEVTAPVNVVGAITGDLSSRRGQITGTQNLPGGNVVVSSAVPLSELQEYAGRLKGMTHGLGTYSMELFRYEPVPARIQEELVQHHRHTRKEEEAD